MHARTEIDVTRNGALVAGSMLVGHIPRLSQGDQTNISFLPPIDDDESSEWVRMVWNKDSQESYSVFDYQSQHLPSIIYRQKRTIGDLEEHPEERKKRHLEMSRPVTQSPGLPIDPPDYHDPN
jgi:hypothetical protein